MTVDEFEASLPDPLPVYLIKKGEDFVQDRVRQLLLAQIQESARSLDWSEFDLGGGDSEQDVISSAQTLPWVSKRRFLWVRAGEAGGEGLAAYLKSPNPRSLLILEFEGRKPGKWPALPVVELKETDPVRWLLSRTSEAGYGMDRNAAVTLVELVGPDYPQLKGELDKLMLYRFEERRIRRQDVLDLCLETRESDAFELIAALASRRAEQALLVVERLSSGGFRLPQLLGILYWNFRRLIVAREMMLARRPFPDIVRDLKIWSYRNQRRSLEALSRERLIDLFLKLKELELRSKTGTVQEREILEGFVVDVCLSNSL